MKNKVIEGQIDMFDLLSYKEMKLRCIKQFSVPKRYFEFRFNTGSIYETYGKNGKTYVQHELIGIEYEKYKDNFEVVEG